MKFLFPVLNSYGPKKYENNDHEFVPSYKIANREISLETDKLVK